MTHEPDFAGRIVQVWCKEPAQGGVLEDARVQCLYDRPFIVGKIADYGKGERDARAGATFWFPVHDILMLTVYPDLQSARAAYAARDKQLAQRPQGPSH